MSSGTGGLFVSHANTRSRYEVCREWLRERLLVANDLLWQGARICLATSFWMPLVDYLRVLKSPDKARLTPLHRALASIRRRASRDPKFYDYGHGYFYQSLEPLLVSGRRRTSERVHELELSALCDGRKVLDLGSNVCFLSLQLAQGALSVDCVDTNPYAIEIGKTAARFMDTRNISFEISDYMDFLRSCEDGTYDTVLLLSSHVSFDHTDSSHLDGLLDQCARVLAKDGTLIFESHPRFFEDRYSGMERTFHALTEHFAITRLGQLSYGSMLDRGRFVAYCRKH
jgi:SAM-dependent methyltransferase